MTGLLSGLWGWVIGAGAVLVASVAAWATVRRSGVRVEQAAELKREVTDSRTATGIAAQTAKESGDQARADLDKEFGR